MEARLNEPLFLGLSPGRSGSRYLAHCLNRAGIRTLHEKNLSPQWSAQGSLGEVSAHLVIAIDRFPRAKVWHFSRHPQPFVTSLLGFGFWRMHAPAIHPYLRRTEDSIADSFLYWVDWHERILAAPEERRTTFRIEDLSDGVLERLAETIGSRESLRAVHPCWEEKQTPSAIPESVREEVLPMMDRLGYAEL